MRGFRNGTIILPDRLLRDGAVVVDGSTIQTVGARDTIADAGISWIDLAGGYLAPGFVDLHVHGAGGADFMDGTEEAFRTTCRVHARHGTTALTPTTTVATHAQHLRFLQLCRHFRESPDGARVLGAHIYGPYFAPLAKGCHPGTHLRSPSPADYEPYLEYRDSICSATVAPELPGAEAFVRRYHALGILCNAGHSHATFPQMEAAVGWGVRHVDHLFCAMSDRARLRQTQTFPMRGGVLEATLYFDELTTEVIADGKHLSGDLLRLAYRIKGPERLALVTDSSRAVDLPDGEYWFGVVGEGERFLKKDGVGVTLDGTALASSVVGMDHCVRTFMQLTGVPLYDVVRMASLTPATILGLQQSLGSIEPGKRADLLVLSPDLQVCDVFIDGTRFV